MNRPSLRELKAQRTRDAIVAAAVALFEDQGYDATSVTQIAERAEVGTRTFFRYFADKEDVLFGGPGSEADILALIRDALGPAGPADNAPRAAVRAAGTVLDRLAEQAGLLPARERIVAATPALRSRQLLKLDRYAQAVESGLSREHGMPSQRAALLARVVVTCAVEAYARWCADPAAEPSRHLGRVLTEAAADLAAFHGD